MAEVLLKRRYKWLLLIAGAGISSYGVYTLYHHPEVTRRRTKLSSLLKALLSVSDVINLLGSDLSSFLRSDSDEIPTSLKQISKLMNSGEFSTSVSRVSEAMTSGIVRGIGSGSGSVQSYGLMDRVVDKLISPEGAGFASAVTGSLARNLVTGFSQQKSNFDLVDSNQFRDLVSKGIEQFVGAMVAAYLEKTKGINLYDVLFEAITNPKHEGKVKDFVVSVSNGAIETLVRTTHRVITNGNQIKKEKYTFDDMFDKVSCTLAVPSNRRFALDVTGRVTFETVRSFLEFTMRKIGDVSRKGACVERGMEVLRYFSAKSMLVITICLAMCMRVMAGTRVLMPA